MEMVLSAVSNVSHNTGFPFFLEKFSHLTRYGYTCPSANLVFPSFFARPASLKTSWKARTITVAHGDETSSISTTTDDSTKHNVTRGRPLRKSKMPPVKTGDLIPGAVFTGKVRAVKPFGAFVDIGAFTEGLIHISNLSNSYVTDVRSIVYVGQEVKVKVVEASVETGRISLTMRENDETNLDLQPTEESSSGSSENKPLSKESSPGNRDNQSLLAEESSTGSNENMPLSKESSRGNRENKSLLAEDSSANSSKNKPLLKESSPGNRENKSLLAKVRKKVSKLVKGQEVDGSVKRLTRGGSIVSLPEGEDGYLPRSEECVEENRGSVIGSSSLVEVGQEVHVRVLNVVKERVTLTMKKHEDSKELEPEVIHVGVVHKATNPFMLAFLKNKEIAKFLEQRINNNDA